jgi:hypothetical protein
VDKLFDELAKSPNVSTDLVQQFVGNYPQLRSQWQIYKVFDLWNDFLSFTALIVLGVLIYVGFKYHSDLEDELEEEVTAIRKKWLKYLAVSFLVLCLVDYALLSVQTYLAPDITMLFEVLKQLKN